MRFVKVVAIVALVVLGIIAVIAFFLGLQAGFGPIERDINRTIDTHSNSFVQSTNIQLMNMMSDWNALEVQASASVEKNGFVHPDILAQQQSLVNTMCAIKATMPEGTVSPDVTSFLSMEGGCR